MNASMPSFAVPQVLLVAPRQPQSLQLATQLGTLGCVVQHGECIDEMLARLDSERPQVLLLDGALALDALQQLRGHSRAPAVVLVAGCAAADRVAALESGADDALAHPVVPRELLARLRAVLRRARQQAPRERALRFGGWTLDRLTRVLSASSGLRVPLSLAEFRLLSAFLDNPGSVLSRERLMDLARGRSIDTFERSIDLLVSRLRTKLDDDPREPRHIRTVRGVGYLFDLLGVDADLPLPAAAMMLPARYPVDTPR
jgi:two-component system OmpR family response regulator